MKSPQLIKRWHYELAGDIKDENIVVDQDLNVKLIDFGSAVMYDNRKPPPYHNRFYGVRPALAQSNLEIGH